MSGTGAEQEKGTLLEACCGAGGEAEGFRKHFEIAHAFDIKPEAVSTYAANHRETDVKRQDIRLLTGCRGDYDGITGVIGGPQHRRNGNESPCSM